MEALCIEKLYQVARRTKPERNTYSSAPKFLEWYKE